MVDAVLEHYLGTFKKEGITFAKSEFYHGTISLEIAKSLSDKRKKHLEDCRNKTSCLQEVESHNFKGPVCQIWLDLSFLRQ